MRSDAVVLGAAPNVDLREVDNTEPAEDVGRRRVFDVTCLTCSHSERVHVEPGDRRTVDHDRHNPTHVVEYVERGGR